MRLGIKYGSFCTSESVQAPDLLKMQRPQELAPEEILAGAVKYGMRGLLSIGAKL